LKEERNKGIESKNRSNTVEVNLQHWAEMVKGSPEGIKWCVRAKMNMKDKVKCLRDPVFYRCNLTPHHRTGTKYKVYPCYDFACPLVDSIEGVTHAMRTIEYRDRNALYKWVLAMTKVRPVEIQDFSRLSFVNAVLSKRKLQYFVDKGIVDGWHDPRFPTVQGIMRRGLVVPAIAEFMLDIGASQNTNLMAWDKLWATNKQFIDPIAPRYSAIGKNTACQLALENGPEQPNSVQVPLHQKNESLGKKEMWFSKNVLIESEDAAGLQIGEKITLYKWGNCIITDKKVQGTETILKGKLVLEDKDFKSTKKITWIAYYAPLMIDCKIIEFGHLIIKPSLDEGDDVDKFINPHSKCETTIYGESQMKNLKKGDIIQIERRGYFYVDVPWSAESNLLTLHFIPDGKTKTMSVISTKIDAKVSSQGEGAELSKKKSKKLKEGEATEGKVEGEESKKKKKQKEKKEGQADPEEQKKKSEDNSIQACDEELYNTIDEASLALSDSTLFSPYS